MVSWAYPYIVHSFSRAFAKPVREWQTAQPRYDVNYDCLYAKCEVMERTVDLSLTKYADDLFKTLAARTLGDLRTVSRASNGGLDAALQPYGYVQNVENQVTLVSLHRKGANSGKMMLFQGEIAEFTRSLGSQVDVNISYTRELQVRLKVVANAFWSMGRVWTAKGVPWRWKR